MVLCMPTVLSEGLVCVRASDVLRILDLSFMSLCLSILINKMVIFTVTLLGQVSD